MANVIFHYEGQEDHLYRGLIVDLEEKKRSEKAPHYEHIFFHWAVEAYSKVGLWSQVLSYLNQTGETKVLVKAEGKADKIVIL